MVCFHCHRPIWHCRCHFLFPRLISNPWSLIPYLQHFRTPKSVRGFPSQFLSVLFGLFLFFYFFLKFLHSQYIPTINENQAQQATVFYNSTLVYEMVEWRCEVDSGPTDQTCADAVAIYQTQQMQQMQCQCCQDGCNAAVTCDLMPQLACPFQQMGWKPPNSNSTNSPPLVSNNPKCNYLALETAAICESIAL